MKKLLLALLILATLPTFAKTVVVSDLDDTLKLSHVRSKFDVVLNAFKTKRALKGSAALFQFLNSQITDISFHYVTNAPSFIMKRSHRKFLKRNKYPTGVLYLRKKYPSAEHKIQTIKNIINTHHPDKMILLGDNGEHDISFYNEIRKYISAKGLNIKLITFIHHIYEGSDVLIETSEQIPFVTPLEILSYFNKSSDFEIDKIALRKLAIDLSSKIVKENRSRNSLLFPKWLECENYSPVNTFENSDTFAKVLAAYDHIEQVCSD